MQGLSHCCSAALQRHAYCSSEQPPCACRTRTARCAGRRHSWIRRDTTWWPRGTDPLDWSEPLRQAALSHPLAASLPRVRLLSIVTWLVLQCPTFPRGLFLTLV